MTYELNRRPDYRPIRRSSDASLSPVQRIMALRSEALVDQARIVAEAASEQLQVHQRTDAAYDLAAHLAVRARHMNAFIRDTGDDPDLHLLHSYIKGASTEAIINLIRGTD
ncbi:hypothetical protein [Catenulispora rubra]|uniref:hypothetical protein n=1 Tax=Catenulispora rubra TaxID=280293 RepID=UPI0018922265|nr:hypothetical protein [Catenulispora rubra]